MHHSALQRNVKSHSYRHQGEVLQFRDLFRKRYVCYIINHVQMTFLFYCVRVCVHAGARACVFMYMRARVCICVPVRACERVISHACMFVYVLVFCQVIPQDKSKIIFRRSEHLFSNHQYCLSLRSKTRKRLKERFLIRRNRTKRANFHLCLTPKIRTFLPRRVNFFLLF